MIRRWSSIINFNFNFKLLKYVFLKFYFFFFRKNVYLKRFSLKKSKIRRKILTKFKKRNNWSLYFQIIKNWTKNYRSQYLIAKFQFLYKFLRFNFLTINLNKNKKKLLKKLIRYFNFSIIKNFLKLYAFQNINLIKNFLLHFSSTNKLTTFQNLIESKTNTDNIFSFLLFQNKQLFLTPFPTNNVFKKLNFFLFQKFWIQFIFEIQKILKYLIFK